MLLINRHRPHPSELARISTIALRSGGIQWFCVSGTQSQFTGTKHPNFADLENEPTATLIQKKASHRLYRIQSGEHDWHVKQFHASDFSQAIRTKLRKNLAQREFENLAIAHDRGVPVPKPLAWAYANRFLLLVTQTLSSSQSLDSFVWQEPEGNSEKLEEALASCARTMAKMHCSGVLHGRLQAKNILLVDQPDQSIEAYITGLRKIRFEQRGGHASADPYQKQRLANVASVLDGLSHRISESQQRQVIRTYLEQMNQLQSFSAAQFDRYFHAVQKRMKPYHFENILIIKPSSLGDVIRAVPVFNGVRSRYPQARISWLVRPDCGGVLQNLSGLDEIIAFDRKAFSRMGRSFKVTCDFFRFLNGLRRKKFDLVLDLQGLFRSGFIAGATCAGVRMGFSNARELAPLFYTDKVPVIPGEHISESLWRFSDALGFGHEKGVYNLTIDPQAKKSASEIAAQAGLPVDQKVAALLIGGTEAAKRWPTERFAQLADWIFERYDLVSVLLGAGQTEEQLAQEVVEQSQSKVINLVGQTDLQELLVLLDSAELVVGNDSGPLHLAAALDGPLVSIYGPTHPAVVGPYGHLDSVVEAGKGVRRKGRYSQNPLHRIETITVETVSETIIEKLSH